MSIEHYKCIKPEISLTLYIRMFCLCFILTLSECVWGITLWNWIQNGKIELTSADPPESYWIRRYTFWEFIEAALESRAWNKKDAQVPICSQRVFIEVFDFLVANSLLWLLPQICLIGARGNEWWRSFSESSQSGELVAPFISPPDTQRLNWSGCFLEDQVTVCVAVWVCERTCMLM